MRHKIFKYGSFTLFTIIVLMGVFVFIMPWLLSTDSIRIRLAQELSSWTGYSVQLKAPPKISLFPKLKASVSGVILSSSDNNQTPIMEADYIEFDLSFLSALKGQVSITESLVISPVFTLDEPVKNINDAFQKISQSEGTLGEAIREARKIIEKNPKETSLNHLLKHPFGKILIKDGTIHYRKSDTGELETIDHVDASLDLPVKNGKASIVISGEWHFEKTELRLEAEQILRLFARVPSPVQFSLNSRRGGVTYSGQARFDDTFFLDGRLAARSPGLDQTLDWLGLEHSIGINVKAPIVWESAFVTTPEKIEFNDIKFSLNDDNARGALEISHSQKNTLVSGSVAFQSLNLDTFLSIYFPDKTSKRQYDLEFLKSLNFDVRVSAPEAQFASLMITNLAAAIQIRNGRGIFDVGNAEIFGGIIQSNIQVFSQDKNPMIEMRLSGSGLEAKNILSAINFPDIVNGKSNVTLNFKAPFVHWSELSSAMLGTYSLEISKGQFLGYDFTDFDNRLKNEHLINFPYLEKGVFPFKWFASVGKIANGRINVDAGVFVNGDKKYNFVGLIPFSIEKDQFLLLEKDKQEDMDFAFNISQYEANSSTTFCADVECLQNSIAPPHKLFLLGNKNRLSITTSIDNK